MKKIETDILVLGSGIAGLSFAIKAAELGKVCIVTKANIDDSNTRLAQGGIACVLDEKDDFEKHIEDTLVAGNGHCNTSTVEMVIRNAPRMIQDLITLGVNFNKEKNNSLELGREGGHSNNRIVHINDESGLAVVNVLLDKARSINNIRFFEHHFAVDLIKKENTCAGAIVLDIKNDDKIIFNSRLTILATGGAGQVYENTTNPEIATGDGFALAQNIGAEISDMEFVQFHPTALFHPDSKGFLISEALRGFGAELVLPDGKPFMLNYHPLGSLAPRDIVSRAIFNEMQKNKLHCVYLDARHLPAIELQKKFPSIYKTCLQFGINCNEDLIPVVPAAHYICGGVTTDINGQTNIDGLYALGEVACTGLHGANRLASNSLLEALVFANNAFQSIKRNFPKIQKQNITSEDISYSIENTNADKDKINYLRKKVKNLMSNNVGIIRNRLDLNNAFETLKNIELSAIFLLNNNKLSADLLELRNLIITAKLIIDSAIKRDKSLGTHFIEDKKSVANSVKL